MASRRSYEKYSYVSAIDRHGLGKTVARYIYRQFQKVITFEICVIKESVPGEGYVDWTVSPDGYIHRCVESAEEFIDLLSIELAEVSVESVRLAFAQGDLCPANFYQGKIVGYEFWANQSVQIRPGLDFIVPDGFGYVHQACTAISHRGKGLHPWRANALAQHVTKHALALDPILAYIGIENFDSLALVSGEGDRPLMKTVGYSSYVRFFGRWLTYRSKACQAVGAGFKPGN